VTDPTTKTVTPGAGNVGPVTSVTVCTSSHYTNNKVQKKYTMSTQMWIKSNVDDMYKMS